MRTGLSSSTIEQLKEVEQYEILLEQMAAATLDQEFMDEFNAIQLAVPGLDRLDTEAPNARAVSTSCHLTIIRNVRDGTLLRAHRTCLLSSHPSSTPSLHPLSAC